MSKLIDKVVDLLPEAVEDTIEKIIGIVDSDSAETKTNNRFNSFADQRSDNSVKWHIDGHDYMYAVSEMLESAKETICILGWWLTPELYLRRPPAYHPEWRLDRVLKRKAEQGVKIHVIIYKEVTVTSSYNSHHTKSALEELHPNIACMRHPDHIGTKHDVLLWSHHEKVVIVDNQRAAVGGLDLSFGRWDTHTHPVVDVHPTEFSWTLFPGQDYNNARVLDFKDVPNYVSNFVSIRETGRMPWHDVHMTLAGPAVLDIIQHFTERWNLIKDRKYKLNPRYEPLPPVRDTTASPTQAKASHIPRGPWRQMGRQIKQRFRPGAGKERELNQGTCRVQVVRSVSEWSHGVPTERSIQSAYRQLILEAQHYIYIENQFFISNTTNDGPVKNTIARALVDRIVQAATAGQKFKVVVVIPEVPGFAGNVKNDLQLKTIMAAQYRTINRGGHSIYEEIRKAGFEPMDYIRFYHLRSYDRINAPYNSFISKMEAHSGVKFEEAQVALARQWIGNQANEGGKDPIEEVYIQVPQPTAEGITQTQAENTKTEKFRLPASEEQARKVIERFEHGADAIRGDEEVADTVSQHRFADKTGLLDEKWLGTAQEEKDAYVSELLYIHTKLMIVDDRKVIMGSANLNDRSMKGDGDSEIALVVEDDDHIDSTMDGKPFQVSRFAATLRRKLYREHLGLMPPQLCHAENEPVTSFMHCAPQPNDDETRLPEDALVADPLANSTLQLWMDNSRKNREIFTEVFRIVPTNLVRNWKAYNNYVPKVKTGHVASDIPLSRIKDRLSLIKGSLVECPLDFLIDEKDFTEGIDWLGLNPTLAIFI